MCIYSFICLVNILLELDKQHGQIGCVTVVCEIWIQSPAAWLEWDRSGFCGHQTSSPGSLRDSKATMSNRRALYWPAFFLWTASPSYLQHAPFLHNKTLLLRARSHAHVSAYIHTPRLFFSLCRQKTLKHVACPQNFGSFCCVFSYAIKKKVFIFYIICSGFLFFFCTDITNGYFNWNFWRCLHLALEWQMSEWLARPGLGWLVCSEACLNQLAAWIACLILAGIQWNPWHFF